MSTSGSDDKRPQRDPAEDNAFFPSPFSLSQFTASKSDLSGADYPKPYTGGRWKILVIGTDERYLMMDNGTMFSTGNHPVEVLLPMYHIHKAGFGFDIATLSGNPVKFEWWAMPHDDVEIKGLFTHLSDQFKKPLKLSDVIAKALGPNSDYAGVFIPGGHGCLVAIPESKEVGTVLEWAMANNKFVISICHGPAGFIAVGKDSNLFRGYKICSFPDSLDAKTPDIGYMPGHLTWDFGAVLEGMGFEIVNQDITGRVQKDRKLLTGDSPLAGNNLGKLVAAELLAELGPK